MCRFLYGNKFSTPLAAQLLDHMIRVYLVLWETAKLSSKVATPFGIPTGNDRVSVVPCWDLVFSVIWILAVLLGVLAVPICISLMVYDVESFSSAYLPSLWPLWWGVSSTLLLPFLIGLFSYFCFKRFAYFGY